MSPGRILLLGLFAAPFLAYSQQSPDAPPVDVHAALQQLNNLQTSRDNSKKAYLQQILAKIEQPLSGSGSSSGFVIDCIRKVQFEGRPGGLNEFTKWRKDNNDLASDHSFKVACDLHLQYLALTLKRAISGSSELVENDVWMYLQALDKAQDVLSKVRRDTGNTQPSRSNSAPKNYQGYTDEMINSSVASGLVAQAYNFAGQIDDLDGWAMAPGDFSAIIEGDLRAPLRKKKDPRLLNTWDLEIEYLGSIAKQGDKSGEETFEKVTYPRLLWRKAQDTQLIGMPNRALSMMMSLVEKYPSHPDFNSWTSTIRDILLKAASGANSPAPAQAPDSGTQALPSSSPAPGNG
ncbi:MAG TPA: hypothetical protein VIM48_09600 [Chthoniobacterales bacterium]